jgi:iron-sulfur cluster assembly protein
VSQVLTMTQTAAEALDAVAASASAPEGAGLRIARDPQPDGTGDLAVTLVDQPQPTDQIVEGGDTAVFVEAETAPYLDDKVLDAQVQDGQVGFTLAERDAPA